MLVSRFVPQTNARKKIILAKVEVEVVLVPTSFLDDSEANISDLGVIQAKT
jgi:hypothetical protein